MLDNICYPLRQLRNRQVLPSRGEHAYTEGRTHAILSLINNASLRGLSFSEPERIAHMYVGSKDRDPRALP